MEKSRGNSMAIARLLTRLIRSFSPRERRARKTRFTTTASSCAVADFTFQLRVIKGRKSDSWESRRASETERRWSRWEWK